MKRTFIAFFPLAVWAAAVLSVGALEIGSSPLPAGSDKAAHFVMYGVGGALAAWAGRKQASSKAAWTALGLVALTGMADEVNQISLPHRDSDIMDWVADATGALFTFLIVDRLLKKGSHDA